MTENGNSLRVASEGSHWEGSRQVSRLPEAKDEMMLPPDQMDILLATPLDPQASRLT